MFGSLAGRLEFLNKFIRWHSWSNTKLIFFIVSIGLVIIEKGGLKELTPGFGIVFWILLAFFVLYGSFASILNDYWDKFVDLKAGKIRTSANIKDYHIFLTSVLFFILSSIFWWFFGGFVLKIMFWWVIMFFLVVFYSSPPVRFKEKPFLDIVVGSLIQRTLPVFLVFSVLDYNKTEGYLFSVALFVLGLRAMLMHQIEDFSSDLGSGVKTLTTVKDVKFSQKLIKILYLPEVLLLLFFSFLVKNINMKILFLVYLIFWILVYLFSPHSRRFINIFSLNEFPLSDFYYVWLPMYIAVSVLLSTGDYTMILLVLVLQKKHIVIFLKKITTLCKISKKCNYL